jgi:hypothetical protein
MTITCSECNKPLGAALFNVPGLIHCPSCDAQLNINAFPALLRERPAETSGEALLTDKEASCFFHPHKPAVIPCASCGRFVCALCDVEFDGQHLCPSCIETGKRKRKIKNLENQRTIYDSIALSVAIIPMLVFYFTFITAPVAIYMSIRYWNAPSSIIPRTKIRFVIAMIVACLQMGGWILLLSSLIT